MERQFEPAFPILDDCSGLGLALRDAGMSLRDYFAAKAMQSFIARGESKPLEVPQFSYYIADEMMKERNK